MTGHKLKIAPGDIDFWKAVFSSWSTGLAKCNDGHTYARRMYLPISADRKEFFDIEVDPSCTESTVTPIEGEGS